MSRTVILFIAMGVVLFGGAAVALIWWSLADRLFPGAARSTGQGGRRSQRHEPPAQAVVVREFDPENDGGKALGATKAASGTGEAATGAGAPPPDRGAP